MKTAAIKTVVYALWWVVGCFMFGVLFRLHVPWPVWALVIAWGFLGGTWAYFTGTEES